MRRATRLLAIPSLVALLAASSGAASGKVVAHRPSVSSRSVAATAAHATPTVARRAPSATATSSRPTPTGTPVVAQLPDGLPIPSATPALPKLGALDHAIVFDDGMQVVMLPVGGAPVALSNLSANSGPFKRPRFSGQGFIYYDGAFFLGDIYGHHAPIPPPTTTDELVYDAWPSPDSRYVAWVLVTPGTWHGVKFSMAASRIVLTDQAGANPKVLLQQTIDGAGGVPIVYGWRVGNPATLLVQNSYGFVGLHKGLEEFNPVTGDLVGDWLPPTGENTQPVGEVLGLSPTGASMVYSTKDAVLPSGEGPLPVNLWVMTLNGRTSTLIDIATQHKDPALPKQPAPSTYAFSRQAFISPDETLVAYTRLDVIYPKGVRVPYIRPVACIARTNGASKADLVAGFRVMGWVDSNTLVLRKDDQPDTGLYTYSLSSSTKTRVAPGSASFEVDGIVP
jgi:hypothetical protein